MKIHETAMKKWTLFIPMIVFVLFLSGGSLLFAQEKQTKMTTAKQDTSARKQNFKLQMDEIEIRGWIEKPQTIFIVPGVNPEVKDILLRRSFVNEILRPIDKKDFEKQKIKLKETIIPW